MNDAKYRNLLDAAEAVLGARRDQMLTVEEWAALARAVAACTGARAGDLLTERDREEAAEYGVAPGRGPGRLTRASPFPQRLGRRRGVLCCGGACQYTRAMRRRAKRIVLLLLAGAIVNVVVAWGCVLLHRIGIPNVNVCVVTRHEREQVLFVYRAPGYEMVAADDQPMLREVATPYSALPWWPPATPSTEGSSFFEASGWPLFALMTSKSVVLEPASDGSIAHLRSCRWGLPLDEFWLDRSKRSGRWTVLPLRPMWHGAVGNTLLYAAILWLPFWGAPALRRAVRRRRGLCPRCAYPVGDGERCSECGTPVPARRASTG
jgi:hypothetical protein